MNLVQGWLAAVGVTMLSPVPPPNSAPAPSAASKMVRRATPQPAQVGFRGRGSQRGFTWVAARNGQQFTNQVVGGREGNRQLVVCRAKHRNGMHPGKVVAGRCNFGYGGREIRGRNYEVLVAGHDARWSAPSNRVPSRAFKATRYDGRQGYVCRATYAGGKHPGKVVAGKCNIGYGGKEVLLRRFETLLEPPPPPPPAPAPVGVRPAIGTPATPTLTAQTDGKPSYSWVPRGRGKGQRIIGGKERGRQLPLCRAPFRGGKHPGKVVAGKCNFGYGGKEILSADFEILVPTNGAQPRWSRMQGRLAKNAFPASRYDNRQGYICRGRHAGGLHPGKVVAGRCNIGYGGREILLGQFQTLQTPKARGPSDFERCQTALQGRIAWDKAGNRQWSDKNIKKLCSGGRRAQPARCFQRVMPGNVNWGGGTNWEWKNAIDLCRGARDADRVVRCFERKIEKRRPWRKAIERCRGR